jgi:hypothetical protein
MANEVKTGDRFIHGIFQKDETSGYGVGGINGMQHNFLGWKNTTVGIASSVFDNLLTQHGITTYDPNYIGALEPIRAGRFLVKWLRVPSFFDPIAISYLKFFLENAVREVSGITSNSLDSSGTVTWGGNQQEMDFPGSMKQGNKTVTLTTLTCSGDGLGKIYRYWQYGITDPVTGIHHLYGKDLRFIRPNYSGSLLYVFLGPTARPGDIEYSCLWHEVWPSGNDQKEIFESTELGSDTAISERQVEFNGIFQDGPECDILAKYVVASAGLAGQSYFDQVLPAYMYKYIDGIRRGASTDQDGIVSGISMHQQDKLEKTAQAETYTEEVLKNREELMERYGLNSAVVPSKVMTVQKNIDDVNAFNTQTFQP